MVEVLEKLDRKAAADVVSAATKALSPNPDIEKAAQDQHLSEQTQKLIAELRTWLHLGADDNSSRAQARLFAALSDLLSDYFVADNTEEIRQTLGQRGELAPGQYKIVFPPGTEEFLTAFRLRKK